MNDITEKLNWHETGLLQVLGFEDVCEREQKKRLRDAQDEIESLQKQINSLRTSVEDHEKSFSLQWEASLRGIKMWQAANPGNDMVWPDRGDMVAWLIGQIKPDILKSFLKGKTLCSTTHQFMLFEGDLIGRRVGVTNWGSLSNAYHDFYDAWKANDLKVYPPQDDGINKINCPPT